MWRTVILALVLLMLAASTACSQSSEGADADPQAVVEGYFAAWNTRNVDDIMSLIADDASVEVNDAVVLLTAREEIRADFIEMFARSEWTIEVSDFDVEGQTVTYNFTIYSLEGIGLDAGRSQATIEGGKIKSERMVGLSQSP